MFSKLLANLLVWDLACASSHLYGVRWSSCESSNGGVIEPRLRPPGHGGPGRGAGGGPGPGGGPSTMTRRGRYLAVHRYAPLNTSTGSERLTRGRTDTSTGSSTSGVDVSMSSSRSELGRRRSTTATAAATRDTAAATRATAAATTAAAAATASGCCVAVVSSLDADCDDVY